MPGTHQTFDGTPHPWEFKRVWHLEPSLTDPETVYAGIEDAALFKTANGGASWDELSGLRKHGSGPHWQPGAGGLCLHTILLDPTNPQRIVIAISAAGAFRTDDGGTTWKPINKGLVSDGIPDADAEVGHCVHHIASHRSRPDTLFMQKHWHIMRSDDAGDRWTKVSGNLPTDFGFVIDVHAHEPETIFVVPIKSDSEHFPLDGRLRVYRSRTGGNDWEPLAKGLPEKDCYVNVLRDAMAVDTLDSCGVYFGTTGGQVYASPDGGDSWSAIVRDLPPVLSVEVQTLPVSAMADIRVVLPQHLQTLARVADREVTIGVDGAVTVGAILDAIEGRFPQLRGTIRDHATRLRPVWAVARPASGAPFVRFFACEEDWSHAPPDDPLPDGGGSRARAVPGRRRDGRRMIPSRESLTALLGVAHRLRAVSRRPRR